MSSPQSVLSGGMITSDAMHGRGPGRWRLVAVAVVVLLLVAAGAFYVLKRPALFVRKSPEQTTSSITPAQAVANAQAALKQADTPKEKAAAYVSLGNAYLANNQRSDAISAYQSSESAAQSSSDIAAQTLALSSLATAYMQAGDTANEIKAIEALIPLLQKSSDPDDKRLAFRYQSLLDSLKAPQ